MARYFEIKERVGAWTLEQPEEIILIDSFEHVRSRVGTDMPWWHEFEHNYFTDGLALLENIKVKLNTQLKRIGKPDIELRETEASLYNRNADRQMRAGKRRAILAELIGKTPEERARMVDHAYLEVANLPDTRQTWVEYSRHRNSFNNNSNNSLSAVEVVRRQTIVENAQQPQPYLALATAAFTPAFAQPAFAQPVQPAANGTPAPTPLAPAQALKLLAATSVPELHDRILPRVNRDGLFEMLDTDLPQPLKDKIVELILVS
jgi:hypothetical protein